MMSFTKMSLSVNDRSFTLGIETKVMKWRAQQTSLAFHLPGVKKKGLVWGKGTIGNAPTLYRSL